ncbi:MAG: hypothetical protein NXH75_06155 [Halobacteriovoraceae bacterium]|jgi:hypothetical protein|nr:hypothetical protein [Halobacteriovoraceae bacterium]
MKFKNAILGVSLLATAALTSCGGGGGGSSYGIYSSPYITVNGFVTALNDVDGAPIYDESEVVLYTDETVRSATPGEEDWFVVYDAKYDEYKAVSLQYIRALTYYDYYSNNYATADEFRERESDDIFAGYLDGDLFGDDYEVVDLALDGYFYGRESGFAYEDESETLDVNLMGGEAQVKKLAQKVSNLSYAYKMSPETALSLVSLGDKAEQMMKKGADQSELTVEDQQVLLNDVQHLTGVSLEEVIASGDSELGRKDIMNKIADKTGANAQTLEDKILPELFGIK